MKGRSHNTGTRQDLNQTRKRVNGTDGEGGMTWKREGNEAGSRTLGLGNRVDGGSSAEMGTHGRCGVRAGSWDQEFHCGPIKYNVPIRSPSGEPK